MILPVECTLGNVKKLLIKQGVIKEQLGIGISGVSGIGLGTTSGIGIGSTYRAF